MQKFLFSGEVLLGSQNISHDTLMLHGPNQTDDHNILINNLTNWLGAESSLFD